MRLFPRRDHPLRRLLRAWERSVVAWLGLRRPTTPPRDPTGGSHAVTRHDPRRNDGGRRARPHLVLVSGESANPGHAYRVDRTARAAAELGWTVDIVPVLDLEPAWWERIAPQPTVVIVWRARWTPLLDHAITHWRQRGSRILCDLDDHMHDPALATPEAIDAIRSLGLSPARVAEHYTAIRRTLDLTDACLVPTAALAAAVQACGRRAFVLPNGFDRDTYRASREAVLRRMTAEADGTDALVRIGYAAGSRTHQRDFAVAAPALARILREHPACRLVLFRDPRRDTPLVDTDEFPDLAGLADRIEWRPLVPLDRLPEELARFDINIVPLEVGNVFCEAKSELKYFEAALVGVPTVASPTQPYRAAITAGRTGFLAGDTAAWHDCLERLVGDGERRRRIGQAALHDVLHRHGPDGRRERLDGILATVRGTQPCRPSPPPANWYPAQPRHDIRQARTSSRKAALAHVLGDLLVTPPRGREASPIRSSVPSLPHVPDARVIRRQRGARLAEVAVVVPLFNYAELVTEALASVAGQSLDSIELVVVDDCSTDDSLAVADAWLARHGGRFVATTLLQTVGNQGLAHARNAGFATAEAPLVFPLDADNTLEARCLWLLLETLLTSPTASAAHPTLQHFGGSWKCKPASAWDPARLRRGNYIDAMALIRKSAWAAVGGYTKGDFTGWEDYDLWCRFVEHGFWSEAVPEAVAGYRVHRESMLKSKTEPSMDRVVAAIRREHPWLTVRGA
jgi:glycosyltransferase involved in cell wall biosynthesis